MPGQGKSKFYISTGNDEALPLELVTLEPDLLHGEQIISSAKRALRFHTYNPKAGETGHLYCTNFRICFVTATAIEVNPETENKRHKFIGADDILLSNILEIYKISSDRRKKLMPGKKLAASPKRIQIYTKDIGIHCFSFEFSDKRERNNLMTTILHYTFLERHDRLFTYTLSQSATTMNNGHSEHAAENGLNLVSKWKPCLYTTRHDLEKELVRLNAKAMWRVTEINDNFEKSITMPEYFAVPSGVPDDSLGAAVQQFNGSRLPMWLYTHSNGGSLVSMPPLTAHMAHVLVEKGLVEGIREAQPAKKDGSAKDILEVDLNKHITSVPDVQSSFAKMCILCAPENVADFYSSDNSYYSQLESASWLRFVTSSLHTASDIAQRLDDGGGTVIIREETSRDLSCVVSSLVQIMLDGSCRTIKGFQNMIQRCWVSAGHPFCQRLAVLHTAEDNIAPVFLVFLDCVYQLTVQFPSSFEFSEIYLITLWDSCVTGLFKEFIFDCNRERAGTKAVYADGSSSRSSSSANVSNLLSVWDWDFQYSADYISLFRNPLYELAVVQQTDADIAQLPPCSKVLTPNCHHSQFDVWVGCFYRNTAPMQILNGGKPAEYFQQCIIMEEIIGLQNKLAKLKSGSLRRSGLYFNATQSSESRMLAKLKSSFITSTFPFNNVISRNVSDISLCTLLERSLILSDRVNDDDDDV